MNIRKHAYSFLSDFPKAFNFMNSVYTRDWANGAPGFHFEYSQGFDDFDIAHTHDMAFWEEGGDAVALCYYETDRESAFFVLKPGYEKLIPELIDHAEAHIRDDEEKLQLATFAAQTALREEIMRRGYKKVAAWTSCNYVFSKGQLPYKLPDGFSFLSAPIDPEKLGICCWNGFDHPGAAGPAQTNGILHMMSLPHFREDLPVIIVAPNGDYACYAGMWLVDEIGLAYMEPLCTQPKYRHLGLASAAMAECQRKTQLLGAKEMTGGNNPFYTAIGFEPAMTWERWGK